MSEFIVDADAAHRCRSLLAQQRADGLAESSDDRMLFACDYLSAFAGCLEDQFLIEQFVKAENQFLIKQFVKAEDQFFIEQFKVKIK